MPASTTALKAVALLVFLLAIGGATYAVQLSLGTGQTVSLRLDAPRALLNATPGHTVTFDVLVTNRGDLAQDVAVSVSGAGMQSDNVSVRVAAGGNMTAFVPVDVPATLAPGTYPLAAHAASADGTLTRERTDLLQLHVLAPAAGFDDSSQVSVLYTGRIAKNGQVFNTNDPAILNLNFAQMSQYVPSSGELVVRGSATPDIIQGLYDALHGIQPGESRTVTVAAADAYGNASQLITLPRTDAFNRTFLVPLCQPDPTTGDACKPETASRSALVSYLNSTNQSTDLHLGSTFYQVQGPNHFPFKVVTLDSANVGFQLDVKVGEKYTTYPWWPNGTEVKAVNNTTATFYSTPTTAVGEPITVHPYWPGMSALQSLNESSVVVVHTPPVGFKYTRPATQTTQSRDETVANVTADAIVVSTPSTNPLAGRDLVFDVLALDVQH